MTPTEMLSAAVASVGVVTDLSKLALHSKIDAEVRDAVLNAVTRLTEAQTSLYKLQGELFRLQNENAQLQRERKEEQDWEARRSLYKLERTLGGAIAYVHHDEPTHYACPNCMNSKQIAILQKVNNDSGLFSCVAKGCGVLFQIDLDTTDYGDLEPSSPDF